MLSNRLSNQIKISKAASQIKVDDQIDEDSWQQAEVAKDFWMAFPIDGEKAPLQT